MSSELFQNAALVAAPDVLRPSQHRLGWQLLIYSLWSPVDSRPAVLDSRKQKNWELAVEQGLSIASPLNPIRENEGTSIRFPQVRLETLTMSPHLTSFPALL